MQWNSRLGFLLIFAVLISVLSVIQYQRTIYLLFVFQVILAIGCVILIAMEAYASYVQRNTRPISKSFPYILAALMALVLIPVSSYMVRTDGGKKILLKAGASDPSEFLDLYLFHDGSYKLLHSGPLSGSFYRGSYELTNDTLHLADDRLDYLFDEQLFVLNKDQGTLIPTSIADSLDYKATFRIKRIADDF